jgi:hypothetical protein
MTKHAAIEFDKDGMIKTIQSAITRFFLSKDFVILIISLALLIAGASFMYDSSNKWVLWKYDDAQHLSIAYNLFHGKGLSMSFLDTVANQENTNIPALKAYDQILNPLRDKGPLYFVLLGGWLTITSANYSNWYFWGIIFNFILVATSVVIFYMLTKRHFGIEIAAYATPVLAVIPGLMWFSVRMRPDALVFVFIIAGIYFIARSLTFRNVVFAGLFASMAYLTHSTGIMLGLAIFIYLLFMRKSKAAAVFIAILALLITPWMVRNYRVLGDATQGFGIPLPNNILIALGLVSPTVTGVTSSPGVDLTPAISLSKNLHQILDEFTNLYGMQFFMVFIACSVVVYLSFPQIKRVILSSRENAFITLTWIFLYSVLALVITSRTNIMEGVIVLVLIPFMGYLYIRFFSGHKDVFTNNGKDVCTILAIFAIVSLLLYLAIITTVLRQPEVRFIYVSLFMLVPLAIIGIKKLLEIPFRFIAASLQSKVISLSMVSILVAFSLTQATAGISSINAFEKPFFEKEYQKKIDKWIVENTPTDAKIATELPHAVLLNTGREAVNFFYAYKDDVSYERWIIKKFDIDYLVFYYPKSLIDNELSITDLGEMKLNLVYKAANSTAYQAPNSSAYQGLIYKVISK